MRYCIWNNKGGVGKSFLTYCLAVEYAIKNPKKRVVVVDMCPQSNISEMLLGGNGLGEKNLTTFYQNRRTIASYITDRLKGGWENRLGKEIDYFVKVHAFNSNLPENLYLLPGDFDLDGCAEVLDYIATYPSARGKWTSSRYFLRDIISVFEKQHKTEIVVFIDTNPSFANYTQASLVAADRLIIPCTADYASIRGIHNIFYRVFGVKEVNGRMGESDMLTFHDKIIETGVCLPKIHMVVLNKSRSHCKKPSAAYTEHLKEIKRVLKDLAKNHKDCFNYRKGKFLFNVKDANALSSVVNYNGLAPSKLRQGQYEVYDGESTINDSQIHPFVEDIDEIISFL